MKALILCAGLGTRLGFKKTPKCMVKVNGKPILKHISEWLDSYGIKEQIVNFRMDQRKLVNYLRGNRYIYSLEDELLGTAGTIKANEFYLKNDDFVIVNGDTLTNLNLHQLITEHRKFKQMVTFSINKKNHHCTGVMVFKPSIFNYLPERGMIDEEKKKWIYKEIDLNCKYFDCGTPAKLQKARRFYKTAH